MARTGENNEGLPSFFEDNPWVEILVGRGSEPVLDFVASPAPVPRKDNRTVPVSGSEPVSRPCREQRPFRALTSS